MENKTIIRRRRSFKKEEEGWMSHQGRNDNNVQHNLFIVNRTNCYLASLVNRRVIQNKDTKTKNHGSQFKINVKKIKI